MYVQNALYMSLQSINIEAEKAALNKTSSSTNGKSFNFFVNGVEEHEKVGTNYYRLLAQPIGAQKSWYATIPYFYMDKTKTPGFAGYVALNAESAALLDTLSSALYKHLEFGLRMKRKTNPGGLDINPKYRNVFLAFNATDAEQVVKPLVLPATNPRLTTGRQQAGTQIVHFLFEVDFRGQAKYKPFTNSDGGLVKLVVAGSNDRKEYIVSVETDVVPITQKAIDQVRKFEDIIAYANVEDVRAAILAKLPLDMHEFARKVLTIK